MQAGWLAGVGSLNVMDIYGKWYDIAWHGMMYDLMVNDTQYLFIYSLNVEMRDIGEYEFVGSNGMSIEMETIIYQIHSSDSIDL